MKPTPQSHFVAVWGWPIALAVLTATGLATALVSDTWGDWWSWVGLGAPVVVIGWFAWPRATAAAATARRPAATTTAPADHNDRSEDTSAAAR